MPGKRTPYPPNVDAVAPDRPMLSCQDLTVAYGAIVALRAVSLRVEPGEIVALLGANGAGKSTLLRTISGLNGSRDGSIRFEGVSLAGLSVERRVRLGIAHVPEGRRIFPGLTVIENLELPTAAWGGRSDAIRSELDAVFALFPQLAERRDQLGWSLSGGEQQMLAIGRALMARPRLLLLDEPSLGLAPKLAGELYGKIEEINRVGVTVLLVEQNTVLALAVASRAYVLEIGEIVLEGASADLREHARVREAYLGA
jgi:branched-chain amino acid transport system ATP-binding protein